MSSESGLPALLKRISQGSFFLAFGISAVSLIGWMSGLLILTRVGKHYISIAPSTAVVFVVLCLSMVFFLPKQESALRRAVAAAGACLAVLVSVAILTGSLIGVTFQAEHLGFLVPDSGRFPLGHMSPLTALLFLAASSGILLLAAGPRSPGCRNTAALIGAAVALAGGVCILGYAYGTPLLYGGTIIPVALPTAGGFVLMGAGLVAASGPGTQPAALFAGSAVRSRLMRALVPAVAGCILFEGLLYKFALPGAVNPALRASLIALASVLVVSIVVSRISWSVGDGIDRARMERERAEEERMRSHTLESIGILAGGVAHDFNNLLTGIISNIGIARMSLEPGSIQYGRLIDAEQVCLIAAELSRRLLTYAGSGAPVRGSIDLRNLIGSAFIPALEGSGITPEYRFIGDLYPVAADEAQMKQVFTNLAANAREAMPHGGSLAVRVENISVPAREYLPLKDGHYVRIAVEDSGAGVAPENLARIFDPYFSTKDTFSKKGLGLGLAVCYSIVKNHGGLLTVESDPGKGTTFLIYLPAAEPGSPS